MTGNRKKPILISCTCSQLRLGIGTPQDYCAFGEFKRVIFHRNHLFMVATLPPDEKKIDSIDLQGIGFFFSLEKLFQEKFRNLSFHLAIIIIDGIMMGRN